jgi:hypothetical protein
MASISHEAKVTQPRVARSEWIKLRSLRSTVWTLIASVVMTVGIALLLCTIALLHLESGHGLGGIDPASVSLYGVYLAQLTYGVLGVLLATSEYSTGMIRSTLVAVPRRLPVLWAKLAVFAVVALVTSEAALAVSMLAGQAILSVRQAGVSLSDPGVLRAMTGAGLYLTVTGLLAVALGFLPEHGGCHSRLVRHPSRPADAVECAAELGWARHSIPAQQRRTGDHAVALVGWHPGAMDRSHLVRRLRRASGRSGGRGPEPAGRVRDSG